MRILVLLVLGFGLGLWAAMAVSWPWLVLAGAALAALLVLTHFKKLRVLGLVLGGLGLGILWFSLWAGLRLRPLETLPQGPQSQDILVTDYGKKGPYGWETRGKLRLSGRTYGLELITQEEQFQPGDRLRGSFRLVAADRNRGGYQDISRGIYLRAYPQGELLVQESPGDLQCRAARLRAGILQRIRDIFPADVSSFTCALLLGDSDGLDPKTEWNLSVSGIRHVVAVSGLHVSILWLLISILTNRRQWLTFLLGLPLLLGFCAVTGFTPSVVRASLMITVMMAAPLLGRQYDGITGLSFGALAMLLQNPAVLTNVSFQLSVASVLGMLLFFKPIKFWLRLRLPDLQGRWARIWDWVCSSAAVSLSALIAVTPLSAWHFGSVTLLSPITNLLTVWLIVWIFWGILLALGLSYILFWPACVLADVTALAIRFVLFAAGLVAKIPFAALYTENRGILLWVLFLYLLGFCLLCRREKHPAIFGWVGAVSLCLVLGLSWWIPRHQDLRATVLDIPGGQSVILQSRGRTYVVSCKGKRPERAADQTAGILLGQGIRRIDGLILTDRDPDTLQGAEYLLSRISADRIYGPEALEGRFPFYPVSETLRDHCGNGTICIFPAGNQGRSHETGLCVLFQVENYDILLPGPGWDGSLPENSSVDCLILEKPIPQNLPETLMPETVILGDCGIETLYALRDRGLRPQRLEKQGTITIRR